MTLELGLNLNPNYDKRYQANQVHIDGLVHFSPETNSSHVKIGRAPKLIFQPSIFRCYVSFKEGS